MFLLHLGNPPKKIALVYFRVLISGVVWFLPFSLHRINRTSWSVSSCLGAKEWFFVCTSMMIQMTPTSTTTGAILFLFVWTENMCLSCIVEKHLEPGFPVGGGHEWVPGWTPTLRCTRSGRSWIRAITMSSTALKTWNCKVVRSAMVAWFWPAAMITRIANVFVM